MIKTCARARRRGSDGDEDAGEADNGAAGADNEGVGSGVIVRPALLLQPCCGLPRPAARRRVLFASASSGLTLFLGAS
jgi:hypothetical protein